MAAGDFPVRQPSGPIQPAPFGLLGLLQLKNLGRSPGALSDLVNGNIDLGDWYRHTQAQDNQQTHFSQVTTGNTTVGTFNGLEQLPVVVPSAEWWWVEQYTLFTGAAGAGDDVTFSPAIQMNAGVGRTTYVLGPSARSNNGTSGATYVPSPFWLAPGATFGYFAHNRLAGTNLALYGTIRYTKLVI